MNKKIPYDQSYKLLFSEPVMVKDLLRGFFDNRWVNELDFTTMQKLNKEHISENLHKRNSDLIWKIKWQDEWLYLVILIEFQSSIDPFMVVRILSYVTLLYEDIIKEDERIRKFKKLPPVLPIVLYNGESPWDAPQSFNHLIPESMPNLLRQYQPDFTYWLLDEGGCIIDKVPSDNLVASLVLLEQSVTPADAVAVMDRLVGLLKGPKFDSVRRAFAVYFERILRAKGKMPDILNELREEKQMLSKRIDIWIEESREKGVSEGISQGISQGERLIVKRLLESRFGSLTTEQESLLNAQSAEALLDIADRVLVEKSVEEVLCF